MTESFSLPSLHDNQLLAYEVSCALRQIKLYVKSSAATRWIAFQRVEGYQFENDAFGNIIDSFGELTMEQFFAEYGSRIAEAFRIAGAPGPWAADIESAPLKLVDNGIRAFVINSSYGLSGWILAGTVSINLEIDR